MSMTDYAQLIDESAGGSGYGKTLEKMIPETQKPVIGLFDHAKIPTNKEGKPVKPLLLGIRNSRIDEIRGGIPGNTGKGAKNDPLRTF